MLWENTVIVSSFSAELLTPSLSSFLEKVLSVTEKRPPKAWKRTVSTVETALNHPLTLSVSWGRCICRRRRRRLYNRLLLEWLLFMQWCEKTSKREWHRITDTKKKKKRWQERTSQLDALLSFPGLLFSLVLEPRRSIHSVDTVDAYTECLLDTELA